MKQSTQTIRNAKGKRPVVAITAYDALTAAIADRGGVDLILVGDSLGNTALGYPSTVPVTVEQMFHHTAAVTRAQPSALVVTDLPFAQAHRSPDHLLTICARIIQEGGASAVKLEGGTAIARNVACLTASGVPVLGHIGLLPQQVLQLGGYRKFGKTAGERDRLLADAAALVEAGVFAVVAEMVHPEAAKALTEACPVPVIGIGCDYPCDGQILVISDVLGLGFTPPPSFAKAYAQLASTAVQAVGSYAQEVRSGLFPPG